MKKISERSFEGAAGEVVRLSAVTQGVAAARVWLDGVAVAATTQFPLGSNRVAVMLAGEPGELCTVQIADVDGGVFEDALLVTAHDPFPISHYAFRTAL
jgi:hypothetical protein